MSIEGFGAAGGLPIGLTGPRLSPALLPLADALALLGLPAGAGKEEVSLAHRAALSSLQAQARAGTLDPGSLRTQVAQLELAVRSIRAAAPPSGASPAPPPPSSPPATARPQPGPTAAPSPPLTASSSTVQAGTPTPTGVAPEARATGPAPSGAGSGPAPAGPLPPTAPGDPLPVAPTRSAPPPPVGQGGPPASVPGDPETSSSPLAVHPDRPGSPRVANGTPAQGPIVPPAATAGARVAGQAQQGSGPVPLSAADFEPAVVLKAMPQASKPPASPAQVELWNATVLPAAERHAETARALATAVVPRADPLWSGAVAHGALTLALADLSADHRRVLRAVAPGVYDQIEAVLPRAVLAGLPPRDHLGLVPLQAWLPGADIKPALLLLLVGLVTVVLWASQR